MGNIKTPAGTNAVKQLLKERPLMTLAELARVANVSSQTAYRWSHGLSNAHPAKVAAAIERMGLDPTDYGLEGTPQPKTLAVDMQENPLQRDMQRVQRQLDLLIEYHRRGNDTSWILNQPNP